MPALELGGESFACRDSLPPGPLLKLAKAQQGDDGAQLAGFYDFVMAMVKPEERARFDKFLDDTDATFDDFDTAIGALIEAYAERPTERPSASPRGPRRSGGTSKVASSPPATGKVVNLSKPAGTRIAS